MSEKKRHEVIIGGTGGQGVITIGYALAAAAVETYKYVTRFPIYMATQRGGPAYITVIFSDEEIAAPILSQADNAVAMEEMGSYHRLRNEVSPGGRLIINSSIVKKIKPAEDYTLIEIPVTDLAQELGSAKMSNIVMVGAYCEVTKVFTEEEMLKTLTKDTSESRADESKAAYLKGASFVRENA
ncbi:MAG: hypothetical protein GY864_11070 [Desulfobacterales bacterium]|nr:hypothetical protein [Desulfobacterales bacterium]